MHKRIVIAGLVAALLGAGLPAAFAQDAKAKGQQAAKEDEKPVGRVEFTVQQMRLIIGGGSGKGVLHFQGKKYPFTFKGASAGGVGATKVAATGDVYNLKKIEDFPGKYSALTTGIALVKGKGASWYQNEKDVRVSVRAKSEGVGFSTGITLATVEFAKK